MARIDRSTWPGWVRALTSPWLLSPVIVLVLLAGTFEGYGYYTRHQPTKYAQGGAFESGPINDVSSGHSGRRHHHAGGHAGGSHKHGAGHHHHSTEPGHTSTGHHTGGSKTGPVTVSHTQSGAGGSHPSPSQSAPATTSSSTPRSNPPISHSTSSHTSAAPSSAPTSSPSAVVTPRVGQYVLAVSGYEQPKFGPISACKNNFPSRATLDVHPSGQGPDSFDFDMRLYPNNPNQHDERHIYNYSPSAVTLTYEQETVTCSGIKQSTYVSYSPQQIRVELPLRVGDGWHNHGGGAARTETGNSKVVKESTLKVQGTAYKVYEIVTKLKMTGSETGTRNQVWWYSPQLAMPLKFGEQLSGKRSGASYTENYTATVISIPR